MREKQSCGKDQQGVKDRVVIEKRRDENGAEEREREE